MQPRVALLDGAELRLRRVHLDGRVLLLAEQLGVRRAQHRARHRRRVHPLRRHAEARIGSQCWRLGCDWDAIGQEMGGDRRGVGGDWAIRKQPGGGGGRLCGHLQQHVKARARIEAAVEIVQLLSREIGQLGSGARLLHREQRARLRRVQHRAHADELHPRTRRRLQLGHRVEGALAAVHAASKGAARGAVDVLSRLLGRLRLGGLREDGDEREVRGR